MPSVLRHGASSTAEKAWPEVGERVDQEGFGGSDGTVFGVESVEVVAVSFDFVFGDDDGLTGEAVRDGVHAGLFLALLGKWDRWTFWRQRLGVVFDQEFKRFSKTRSCDLRK